MRIKSYFARTVEDAMAMAAQELGPEAMLVNSRKALPEARQRGEYEVVFATDLPVEGGVAMPAPEFPGPAASVPVVPGISDRLSREVAELKKELEGMRRALTRSVIAPARLAGAPEDLSDAYAVLTAGDVPPEMAREIVERAETRHAAPRGRTPQRRDPAAFQRALAEELESRFTVQPVLGRSEVRPSIVALVGPPGAGKTTTLVKLAVNYGLASRRPMVLLSMDNYRIAAPEQLRSLAAILGVGFQLAESPAAVAQAIEENRTKDLILIDTPGFGFLDTDSLESMAQFFATRNDIDTHLVLPSSMKAGDLARVVESFAAFRPSHLLFTRLDETASYGPIFAEAARTGKPLSFFGTGQRIPEDLETASRSRLVELMLRGPSDRARSAA